jgi:hypothetical protein
MDWRVVGALTLAILSCGLLGVGVIALVVSGPGEQRRIPTSPTLVVESGAGRLTADVRPIGYSAAPDIDSESKTERLSGADARPPPSTEPLERPAVKAIDKVTARRPLSSDHTKLASPSVSTPLRAQPKIPLQEWRAVATARASRFNLGGHLDQSGLVDSMASGYLRDAFKKSKNYNKLPPEAKAWIDEPNINLSKLAPYRVLLGIDDGKIEQEQAVKFVQIASTRGIEVGTLPASEEGDADPLVLPPFN